MKVDNCPRLPLWSDNFPNTLQTTFSTSVFLFSWYTKVLLFSIPTNRFGEYESRHTIDILHIFQIPTTRHIHNIDNTWNFCQCSHTQDHLQSYLDVYFFFPDISFPSTFHWWSGSIILQLRFRVFSALDWHILTISDPTHVSGMTISIIGQNSVPIIKFCVNGCKQVDCNGTLLHDCKQDVAYARP